MGEAVNEVVRLIFSLSVSGGLLALILFAVNLFARNRLSKSFQYYIWLAVLLRFIMPFSFGINLMDFMFNTVNIPQMAEEILFFNDNPVSSENIIFSADNNAKDNENIKISEQRTLKPVFTDKSKLIEIIRMLIRNLFGIWFIGVIISVAFNIIMYLRSIRYMHSAAYELKIMNCVVKILKSRFAPVPLLVGAIKPRIYLPDIEYTDEQLNNILLHELTHFRRHDIWLKWFAALVVSVHWFNPIVYYIRREFNRACELSCDEAVIRNLNDIAKQSYGETLISVVSQSRCPVKIVSVAMCEEKEKLKERLVAIMTYKKMTNINVLITVILTLLIMSSAVTFGASVETKNQNPETESNDITIITQNNENPFPAKKGDTIKIPVCNDLQFDIDKMTIKVIIGTQEVILSNKNKEKTITIKKNEYPYIAFCTENDKFINYDIQLKNYFDITFTSNNSNDSNSKILFMSSNNHLSTDVLEFQKALRDVQFMSGEYAVIPITYKLSDDNNFIYLNFDFITMQQ